MVGLRHQIDPGPEATHLGQVLRGRLGVDHGHEAVAPGPGQESQGHAQVARSAYQHRPPRRRRPWRSRLSTRLWAVRSFTDIPGWPFQLQVHRAGQAPCANRPAPGGVADAPLHGPGLGGADGVHCSRPPATTLNRPCPASAHPPTPRFGGAPRTASPDGAFFPLRGTPRCASLPRRAPLQKSLAHARSTSAGPPGCASQAPAPRRRRPAGRAPLPVAAGLTQSKAGRR